MKKVLAIFKKNSVYLLVLTFLESILSIFMTIGFVYTDTLSYDESLIFNATGVQDLLQSMYTSTWWALVLFLLFIISALDITTLVFRKLEYRFLSILCWVEMFILSINLTQGAKNIMLSFMLFIPILIINIIVYNQEKKKLEKVLVQEKRIETRKLNKEKKTKKKSN